MYATDLVGINGITRVLLVYTCQRGAYPRGHVVSLRLPQVTVTLNRFFSLFSDGEGRTQTANHQTQPDTTEWATKK
jgi:hypothetical protein